MPDDAARLCKDPFLPWSGPFPYERVAARLRDAAHPGVGPGSSAAEVNDALYDLMLLEAFTEDDHQAWHELHSVERRLFLDFCHYQLRGADDDPEEAQPESTAGPRWLPALAELVESPPMPPAVPDGDSPAAGEAPRTVPVDPALLVVPPVEIGPVELGGDEVEGE